MPVRYTQYVPRHKLVIVICTSPPVNAICIPPPFGEQIINPPPPMPWKRTSCPFTSPRNEVCTPPPPPPLKRKLHPATNPRTQYAPCNHHCKVICTPVLPQGTSITQYSP
ncbi:hypothetical protein DPMN_029666 [Dreissena polymorpha]|uniref:Uncharacterized protein n=1 Tax=Dreissena polymorpha TaxID=45954 RepID=A0A9D4LZ34_DREPO|nr:hypothetical protein DPMN_029666 [Dreissena polymorpha]